MTIYKYIFHRNELKVSEMEADNRTGGYVIKRGKAVCPFIKRNDIGKAIGTNLKHVYLLKRDDALAVEAFIRYKRRNLERLQKDEERLRRDISILEKLGGNDG